MTSDSISYQRILSIWKRKRPVFGMRQAGKCKIVLIDQDCFKRLQQCPSDCERKVLENPGLRVIDMKMREIYRMVGRRQPVRVIGLR